MVVQGLSTGAWGPCDVSAAIPDSALSGVVRTAIARPEGPLDLLLTSQVRLLDASGRGLKELDGLACLPSLTRLNLPNNSLVDVGPLSKLTALTWLDLTYNHVADVEPLAALTNLETLILSSNAISDITPLAALVNLKELGLDNLPADLVELLSASTNTFSDIQALAGLTRLEWLDLTRNQVANLEPLLGLQALAELRLAGNPLDCASAMFGPLSMQLRSFTIDC